MNKIFVLTTRSLAFVLIMAIVPAIALSTPITYEIGPDDPDVPGFGASFLHSAGTHTGGGYFANGNTMRISGMLTIDLDTGAASGILTGPGSGDMDFGKGDGEWTLQITGGGKTPGTPFFGGIAELLHLDYELFKDSASQGTGSFYFADRDFNGGSNPSPNTLSTSQLILWGNNWINTTGDSTSKDGVAMPLGIDLFGTPTPVPEPTTVALLGIGLVGFAGTAVRRKWKKKAIDKS